MGNEAQIRERTGTLGSIDEVFACISSELGKFEGVIPMQMMKHANEKIYSPMPNLPVTGDAAAEYDPDEAFKSTVFYRSPNYQIKED